MSFAIFAEDAQRRAAQPKERKVVPDYVEAVERLFEKPSYRAVQAGTEEEKKIAVLVYTDPKVATMRVEKPVFADVVISNFGSKLLESAEEVEHPRALPRWRYYEIQGAPEISDVLKFAAGYLTGMSPLTTLEDYTKLTLPGFLNKSFLVSRELLGIVEHKDKVRLAYVKNESGGVDVLARVRSMSDPRLEYTVILSVRDRYGDREGITVTTYCSCPIGREGALTCKHVMAVLAIAPHVVLSAVDYLYDKHNGTATAYEEYLKYWTERTEQVADKMKNMPAEFHAGFIYYFTKFLLRKKLMTKVTAIPYEKAEKLEGEVEKVLNKLDSEFLKVEKMEVGKEVEEVVVGDSTLKKIVWTKQAEELRAKVQAVIKDLDGKFGLKAEGSTEWALMLAYALTMSADRTKPPVILLVVGEPGSFKTLGSTLLREYSRVPLLEFTYRGAGVADKYREFLRALTEDFDIPVTHVERTVGGVVARLWASEDTLRISLSAPYLYSIALRMHDSVDKVKQFVQKVANLGFGVQVIYDKPSVNIISPFKISEIENDRLQKEPNRVLGTITLMDALNHKYIVIDEGTRNPGPLEFFLTQMSVPSLTENYRVMVITSNIGPYVAVATDPNKWALLDRTVLAVTSALGLKLVSEENLRKPPSVVFDEVELLALQKFIESIPVPEGARFLASVVEYALSHKFALLNVNVKPTSSVKIVTPANREDRFPSEYDLFEGMKFKFTGGGRFEEHTLRLARFFAFLEGHDHVTLDDLKRALRYTIRSRLVIEDADTYVELKIRMDDVVRRASEIIDQAKDAIGVGVKIMQLMESGNTSEMEKAFEDVVSQVSRNPVLAPVIVAAVHTALSLRKLDKSRLSDRAKLTAAAVLYLKGDMERSSQYEEEIEKLRRAITTLIKPAS